MNRLLVAVAGGLGCLALAAPASATFIPPSPEPVPVRVALADAVVVGTVVRLADKTVSVPAGQGLQAEYKVAIVKVTEGLQGAETSKEIRVGFIPPPPRPAQPPRPGGLVFGQMPNTSPQLTPGLEGCFFLNKVPGTDCYTASLLGAVVEKKSREFRTALVDARRAAKLLADPRAGLTSRSAPERFLTASLLVHRYRTPQGRKKTEPIDAEESKLILKALAESDWSAQRPVPGVPALFMGNPHLVIMQLGAGEKDGWVQPRNFRLTTAAARKWFKDHVETFRIEKYVAAEDRKAE
jgi:hypothetical protein